MKKIIGLLVLLVLLLIGCSDEEQLLVNGVFFGEAEGREYRYDLKQLGDSIAVIDNEIYFKNTGHIAKFDQVEGRIEGNELYIKFFHNLGTQHSIVEGKVFDSRETIDITYYGLFQNNDGEWEKDLWFKMIMRKI